MEVKKIVVIGAGQMGSGIAQVCAQSGYDVLLQDINQDAVDQGINSIHALLTRAVEKGRITDVEKDGTLSRLNTSTDLGDVHEADLVIEAVIENLDVKKELFQQLDNIVPAHTILATNTSSLPITEIAAVTNRPEKVIGMHFMNPVPIMKLVEIIRALQTDDETYEKIEHVTKELNKTSVTVNDFPGFVANRILMPMINEAIYTVYEGIATVEDVDTVMKLGMNHPMGPLTLADFIGLDTCLYIMEVLYEGFGDSKYRPCPLLRQYVQAGWYGKKSGRGFYTYA
ncbi:3-hydroxybutyryl-CoA dehydrogenase [Pseudogracilibacillus sp. SO30301A]|uniref:3-hydroxybutyryl-CoA dehydrogenase n=1 Tax=Pseudogracilibacillus sp. SO30301A TaxID=3098291 RepID=UPI00300DDDA5